MSIQSQLNLLIFIMLLIRNALRRAHLVNYSPRLLFSEKKDQNDQGPKHLRQPRQKIQFKKKIQQAFQKKKFKKQPFESFDSSKQKDNDNNIGRIFRIISSPFNLLKILGLGVGAIAVLSIFRSYLVTRHPEITFEQLCNMLEEDEISKLVIHNIVREKFTISVAYVHTPNMTFKFVVGDVKTFKQKLQQKQLSKARKIEIIEQRVTPLVNYLKDASHITEFMFNVALLATIVISMRTTLKSGNVQALFQTGKKTTNIASIDNIKTRFKDVAGLQDAKVQIMEFVDFLKNPKKYKDLGARIPKGALLSGPPGTGKTMLAKACAGQAGVPFFSMSGSQFVEIFVGVGAARVRELFAAAKKKTPAIIFIDEIDAVGKKRDERGGHDERANTLNQLLVQMDGFGTSSDIIVLAATNRRELLDPALTRPGRFDRSIQIPLPDLEGRKQIFAVHLQPIKLSKDKPIEEYAKRLATLTPGFSGADIYNICNQAAILAARKDKNFVDSGDFESATERIIGGVEKKRIITEAERKIVSYHQCGHAVTSWFLEGAYPLLKLTIIPRSKGSLGFAQYLPTETNLESKQQLLDRICVILGGRCSQEHFFKRVTTGASDDLQKIHQTARTLVVNYGMSEKIGYIGYRESQYEKSYSEQVNKVIDQEVNRIVSQCTEKTRELIKKYQSKIEELAKQLLEKQTIDSKTIIRILGQRPFKPKSNYKDYLQNALQTS